MRILLLGNYPYLKSQSMDRFAAVLDDQLRAAGHKVRLLIPQPVFGQILPSATGLGKWLGYLDRFLLFRSLLNKAAEWAEVVHICDQANAIYIPWLNRKPHVVTCHDMIAIQSALGKSTEHKTRFAGKIYQRSILSGLKQAQHVVCVSETTQEELLRLTELPEDKISVVNNGLNYPYRPMGIEESLYQIKKSGLGDIRPYFLHVGGNFWYKNRIGLLQIFAQINSFGRSKKYFLVIVGSGMSQQLRALSKKLRISKEIKFTINVTNEQLRAFYSMAEGLVFPSLYEGFGWPIIEAQACGCPVFTSNMRPMTDVGGDGAVYFNPLNASDAAGIILQAIENKEKMRRQGYQNIAKFSTVEMIKGYIQAYRLVAT